jgi:hypothetical protein
MALLQLLNNETVYPIPQQIDLDLPSLLDEHNEVIRLALGTVDPEEQARLQFALLFARLEEKSENGFIDGFTIIEGDTILIVDMATIVKMEKPYGVFYDIEAGLNAVHFSKRNDNGIKGKKAKRKRKVTNKVKSK